MRKVINFRAAAFAAIGLISGIFFSRSLFLNDVIGAILSLTAAVVVFVVFTFFSSAEFKGAGKLLCLLFFVAVFAFGGLNFRKVAKSYENANLGGHKLTVIGKVSEVSVKENYEYIIMSDITVSGAVSGKSYYKLALYVYGKTDLRLGDRITFDAVVSDRTLFYNGRFSASSIAQGIKYFAEVQAENISLTERAPDLFEKCNLFIFDTLKAGLKDAEFPIAYAMLTGNSDYIAEENLMSFRAAGVAHIFAVSGLHIGFLATVLYFVFRKIKINDVAAFLITLACCIFYAGICGFSASSVRAVIMFFFMNISRLAGLKYDGISAVCAAAFVILTVSPAQLFCAGFELSFAVVSSIIILFIPLKKPLKFLPDKISSALAVSFAAELGGAPVLLYFFGEFATLSLFTNILLIPVVGVLFVALIVCTVLGGIFSPAICLFLPEYALLGLNFVITAVDFKAFLVGGFTFGAFSAAYYGVVVVAGGLLNFKKITRGVICLLLAIICALGTWTISEIKNGKLRATVIGSDNLSAALFTLKGETALVISDISYRNFSQYRLEKAAEDINDGEVSVVILKQNKPIDLTAMTVRLRYVINVTEIYYYGERDESAENVLDKTFPFITVTNMTEGDGFYFAGGKCEFLLGGRCLFCSVNGYNTAVFSSFEDAEDCANLTVRPDTAICYDKHNTVLKTYSPERLVSFKTKEGYIDGMTQGNLSLLLG